MLNQVVNKVTTAL